MLPRLLLIFVFFVLIILAVKKGLSPQKEVIHRVPGYPAPVALKKADSISNEEFLKSLPLASDYAFSMAPIDTKIPVIKVKSEKRKMKITKRTVATKMKLRKR